MCRFGLISPLQNFVPNWRHSSAQAFAARDKALAANEFKSSRDYLVTRHFQPDLCIATFPEDVYNMFLKVLRKLDKGTMVGLKTDGKDKEGVKRHQYRTVASFPAAFYRDTFKVLLSDNPSHLVDVIGRVSGGASAKTGATTWASTSIVNWFERLRKYALWVACYYSYKHFCHLLLKEAAAEKKVEDWKDLFKQIVEWDPDADTLTAFESLPCRTLIEGLVPAKKDPLLPKAIKSQDPGDDRDTSGAIAVYKDMAAGCKGSWFPQFLYPKLARNPKASPKGSLANRIFDRILDEHARLLADEKTAAPSWSVEVAFNRSGRVVRRPNPQDNLLLTGAGNGLHLLTSAEREYVAPIFTAAKAWMAKQPYLLYPAAHLITYLQFEVLAPLVELAYAVCTVGSARAEPAVYPCSCWSLAFGCVARRSCLNPCCLCLSTAGGPGGTYCERHDAVQAP